MDTEKKAEPQKLYAARRLHGLEHNPSPRHSPKPEKWYDDPLMVVFVLAGSTIMAVFVIWVAIELKAQYEIRQMEREMHRIEQKIKQTIQQNSQTIHLNGIVRTPTTAVRPTPAPTLPKKWIPAKSREECLEENRGIENMVYHRCRGGYFVIDK